MPVKASFSPFSSASAAKAAPAAPAGSFIMPPARRRILFPLAALLSIIFFVVALHRYDRDAFTRLGAGVGAAYSSSSLSSTSTSSSSSSASPSKNDPAPPRPSCEFDPLTPPPLPFNEWVQRRNFTRAYFRPHHVDPGTEFRSLEDIEKPVLPPFRSLERGGFILEDQDAAADLPCPNVIDVDVAADYDVAETAKLLFGLATTADRLDRLLPSLLYSYGSSRAGILVLVPESDDDLELQEAYFRARGLDITLQASPLEFTARYFGLVEAFSDHIATHRPHTEWVAFIDDDTFFPSLATVAHQLRSFDPSHAHYIGAHSEAIWQVETFGHIAFGGAGVFVSKPLLDILMESYEECQSWGEQPGDQKLGQCIERFGDTPLTLWPSLYQMDVTGEPDGVYESGRRIDSLHHWGSWYSKDVVKMSTVAAAAGRKSVLRRWVFDQDEFDVDPDEDAGTAGGTVRTFWVLTNGYSIVKYTYDPDTPDEAINFDHTEKTWEEDAWGYEHRLGPLRPKEQDGITKERWLLKEAFVLGDNVHQLYTLEQENTHSVIEIVWLGPKGGGGAGVGGVQTTF
jgi:hypothetical protein